MAKPEARPFASPASRRAAPAVVIEYENGSGAQREVRRNIPKVEMNRPKALTAHVRAGDQAGSNASRAPREGRHATEYRARRAFETHAVRASRRAHPLLRASHRYGRALERAAREHVREASTRTRSLITPLETLAVRAGWEHKIDWENEPFGRRARRERKPGALSGHPPLPGPVQAMESSSSGTRPSRRPEA